MLKLDSDCCTKKKELVPIFHAPGGAPEGVEISAVRLIPAAGVTGANTNTTHLNLQNRGIAGISTTELAAYDLTLGNDLITNDAYELYAPASRLLLVTDSVLALQLEKVGTGLLVPNMLVVIEFFPV